MLQHPIDIEVSVGHGCVAVAMPAPVAPLSAAICAAAPVRSEDPHGLAPWVNKIEQKGAPASLSQSQISASTDPADGGDWWGATAPRV